MAMKRKSAMKAMKAMKAKKSAKAMKSMKRRSMKKKVSIRGKKWQVLKGSKLKTNGGLKKTDLTKNKAGRVVSKKASLRGKKNAWGAATKRARQALGVKGFCPVGGKSSKGQALLKKVRSL